jgi:hypothetical protein
VMKRLVHEPPSKLNAELLTEVKSFCDSHLQDDATLITIAVGDAYAGKNSENHIPSVLACTSNS